MSDSVAAASSASVPAPQVRTAWHDPSGFGFRDILDIVNPLQHLPIIGSLYRWLTGDRPGAVAQVAGDALYGGPIGAAVGLVSAAAEDSQGRDLGERALAAVFGSDAKTTAVAAATAPAATAAAATAPASPAPATVASAAPPPRLDHAPMPLFGGIAQPPPAFAAAASSSQTPAQQFLARNAGALRPAAAAPRAAGFQPTAPVPLVLPAGALPAAAAAAPPNPQAPVDISQKMMDALDKYMRLEREREAAGSKPDTPALDLAL